MLVMMSQARVISWAVCRDESLVQTKPTINAPKKTTPLASATGCELRMAVPAFQSRPLRQSERMTLPALSTVQLLP